MIVVDGGSVDDTAALARPRADRVIAAPARTRVADERRRGHRAGRQRCCSCTPTRGCRRDAADAIARRSLPVRAGAASISPSKVVRALLPVVAATMNARSRLTGIATGDQAMFVVRDVFVQAGGFPAARR